MAHTDSDFRTATGDEFDPGASASPGHPVDSPRCTSYSRYGLKTNNIRVPTADDHLIGEPGPAPRKVVNVIEQTNI